MTPNILDDPAPIAVVTNYGESSIEYHVRCWSRVETYWTPTTPCWRTSRLF